MVGREERFSRLIFWEYRKMKRTLFFSGLLLMLVCCTLFHPAAGEETSFSVRHASREEPRIAITVDDCYDIVQVQAAIDLCLEYRIPMTFFPIGNALKFADGPVWQQALDAGCEIGNHTWGHVDLTGKNAHQVRYQMLRTQQKIDEMLGYHYPMQVMRPPMGKSNKAVQAAVASVGYLRLVKWDVSQTDPDKAIKAVRNGSILLYHGRAKDIRCLQKLIPQLLEQGYQCVTVSQLLGLPEIVTSDEIYQYQRSDAD